MSRHMHRVAVALIVTFFVAVPAFAQPASVRLAGRVIDPQQAPVAGALIAARNTATGTDWTTTSGMDGRYVLPMLPPGTYDVDVKVDGFATFRAEQLTLAVGQDRELDVPLALRALRETVVVANPG